MAMLAGVLGRKLVVDCRNIFDANLMKEAGLRYAAFGKPEKEQA